MRGTWFWLIWEAPQTLVALAYLCYLKVKRTPLTREGCVYRGKIFNGVCLGEFVFLEVGSSQVDLQHELGHRKQSRMLGPLYLFVVGLPSVSLNLLDRYLRKRGSQVDYYAHFPENWADKLGGVQRHRS